ncbi:MAG: signal recognition particle protein, partial [Terriglobia bacterium]
KKMGPLEQVLDMIPGVAPEVRGAEVDERRVKRLEAIIDSMTAKERRRPDILNGKRRKRVARGSGTSVQEVNQLLRQYAEMRRLMKSLQGGRGDAMRKLAQRFGLPAGKAGGRGRLPV